MEYVTIVVAFALWEYTFFSFKTGMNRGKYGVKVPSVSGNIEWEKYYRVQCNTLEQLITFIPAIYGFAYFVNPIWAAALGCVVLVGRIIFYLGYISDTPSKRTPGFMMTFFPNQILLIGTVIGAILSLLK
jgi:glutathione S-transferase